MAALLPVGVAFDESWDGSDGAEWTPEEAIVLGRSTDERRREFAQGRTCARRALRRLGVRPEPVLRGAMREPVWPAGVVGSITHCDGYAAAAVGRRSHVRSIGIDAERRRPLPPGVLTLVATPTERGWLGRVGDSGVPWDAVLFSAKESVFKAWFPLARSWLSFDEAEVVIDAAAGEFRASLAGREPREIGGRFDVGTSHVFTCAVVPTGAEL